MKPQGDNVQDWEVLHAGPVKRVAGHSVISLHG